MTPVRLKPAAPRSRVKHSTTEPLRSLNNIRGININHCGDERSTVCLLGKKYGIALSIGLPINPKPCCERLGESGCNKKTVLFWPH